MSSEKKIPEGVRRAALDRLQRAGMTGGALQAEFLMREGHGDFRDYLIAVDARHDGDQAERVRNEVQAQALAESNALRLDTSLRPEDAEIHIRGRTPLIVAAAVPDSEFVKMLDVALDLVAEANVQIGSAHGDEVREETAAAIDAIFRKRGVPYAYRDRTFKWSGDAGAHAIVVEPALKALADPRMVGARSEFEAAISHLSAGSSKDLEDAIEEAAKSVESAMKVLAQETGATVAPNATAKPLLDALKAAGIVPDFVDNLIQAPARIRNKMGGHGAGAQPRIVPKDVAEACVSGAATALVFLIGRLP